MNIIFELQSRTPYDDTSFAKIYHDISSFQRMEKTRDMSTMKLIGNTLADYFQNRGNAVMVNKPTSFFSGCGKKKIENVDKVTHDSARVFLHSFCPKYQVPMKKMVYLISAVGLKGNRFSIHSLQIC